MPNNKVFTPNLFSPTKSEKFYTKHWNFFTTLDGSYKTSSDCNKLNEIYKLFVPFIESQGKYLTSNNQLN